MRNIAASMLLVGTVAVGSAFAQVEDQEQMETQDPTQDPTQTDPSLDQPDPSLDQPTQETEDWSQDQKQREEIEITEVPADVSETLNSGEYQDMQPTRAYKVTDEEKGKTFYEVEFTNAQGTTETKKFDEKGDEVKKDKKKDDY